MAEGGIVTRYDDESFEMPSPKPEETDNQTGYMRCKDSYATDRKDQFDAVIESTASEKPKDQHGAGIQPTASDKRMDQHDAGIKPTASDKREDPEQGTIGEPIMRRNQNTHNSNEEGIPAADQITDRNNEKPTERRPVFAQSISTATDVEADANPIPPSPIEEEKTKDEKFTYDNPTEYQKRQEMYEFENSILRPKNQFEEPLSINDLVDVVIVYAKSDYEIALRYQEWLHGIADASNIHDIKVELYTCHMFPDNDVQVVEEVVNKSMRVVMLLSKNFTNEINLCLFKEEAIGLTRLQEVPSDEQMSLFASAIMKRKKDSIRPVHTCPKKKRSYRNPVGLSALRGFEFYDKNPSQKYEEDMAKQFLKGAREDRNFHAAELRRHQAFNNPTVTQPLNETNTRDDYNKSFPRTEINDLKRLNENTENPKTTTNNLLKSSDVVCQSKKVILNVSSRSLDQQTGPQASGFCSGPYKNSASGVNSQTSNPIASQNKPLLLVNSSKTDEPESISKSIQEDSGIFTQQGATARNTGLNNRNVNNEHGKGLQNRTTLLLPTKPSKEEVSPSETQLDIEEDASNLSIPQFANQKTAVKDEFLKTEPPLKKTDGSLKQKSHEKDDDEIMSSTVSYAGGKKKSERLKATPNYEDYADPDANSRRIADYNEYMAGVPSDNPLQQERINPPRGSGAPTYQFPPPPYTPPVATTAPSIHYHVHTHLSESSVRQDVETDGGTTRRQESRRDLHADEGLPQRRQGRDRRETPENTEQRSGSGIVYNIQGCGAVVIGDRNAIVGDQHVNSSNNARATGDADSTATENHINEDQFVMERNSETDSADEEEQLQSFDDSQRDSLDLSAEPYMDGRPNTNEDDRNVREEENETRNNNSARLTDNEQINQEGIHPSEPTLNSDENQRDERSNERIQNRLSGESDALEQDRTVTNSLPLHLRRTQRIKGGIDYHFCREIIDRSTSGGINSNSEDDVD